MNNDRDPDVKLKFGIDRVHPAMDLVSGIDLKNPSNILDIGCGPGNGTQVLHKKWPNSKIIGIDNSEALINKAKQDYPDQEWKFVDVEKEIISDTYDIVFLNAAIHKIPDLIILFNKLKNCLSESGVLAIQLPLFTGIQLGDTIKRISGDTKWAHLTKDVNNVFMDIDAEEYYDILSGIFSSIEVRGFIYIHIMKSHNDILEMIRSACLRPYLDKLESETDKKEFESNIIEEITEDCEVREDGKTLFPFQRLLIIAKK